MQNLLQRVRGILVTAYIVVSLSVYWSTIVPALIVASLFSSTRKLAQHLIAYVVSSWITCVLALVELMIGTKFLMYGDVESIPKNGERAIIISNHHTRLDWLFIAAWSARFTGLRDLRIVLKDSLARAPMGGWAIQTATYLFLSRDWARDAGKIGSFVRFWTEYVSKVKVLVFPEGTNLTPYTKGVGHAFCEKNSWPKFSFVLPPRMKGFCELLMRFKTSNDNISNQSSAKAVRPTGNDTTSQWAVDAVYDLTLAYSPEAVEDEADMLIRGRYPQFVHIHCTRYPLGALPLPGSTAATTAFRSPATIAPSSTPALTPAFSASHPSPILPPNTHTIAPSTSTLLLDPSDPESPLKQWLYNRFAEKEVTLQRFYTSPALESVLVPPVLTPHVLPPVPYYSLRLGAILVINILYIILFFAYLLAPDYRFLKLSVFFCFHALSIYFLTIKNFHIDEAIIMSRYGPDALKPDPSVVGNVKPKTSASSSDSSSVTNPKPHAD